ncbi:MAG: glutathione S-transferase C-terminal domain-containing protein [Rubrobacter sp.]|nr:glutathione S-transferase C-terminal domain-containing protein [Rubrobacter sp.]
MKRSLKELYEPVNNGVYHAGFATEQVAYEEAVTELFDALDRWEKVLGRKRYLCGDRIAEADWAFFTTLVRCDPVYHGHFKCNLRRIVDYSNLWGYLKDLYQQPGIVETVDLDYIKRHYYISHKNINPTAVVSKGSILIYYEPRSPAFVHVKDGVTDRTVILIYHERRLAGGGVWWGDWPTGAAQGSQGPG